MLSIKRFFFGNLVGLMTYHFIILQLMVKSCHLKSVTCYIFLKSDKILKNNGVPYIIGYKGT